MTFTLSEPPASPIAPIRAAVAQAVVFEPVIGPAPLSLSEKILSMLRGLWTGLINGLIVAGWIVGLTAILALASPTFSGWAEDAVVSIVYAIT